MRCDLCFLVFAVRLWLASAARPTKFAAIEADLVGRSEPARRSRACPQEEPLRQVLLGLGFEEDELSDLRDVGGVEWSGCDVLVIDFEGIGSWGHAQLHGSLSEAFLELPKLRFLNLKGTEVSGDLAVLEKCNELTRLELSGMNVTGDLKALENAVGLRDLGLSQTKVAGDLEALKTATKLQFLELSNAKVEGNIEALHMLTKLRSLHLSNTKVEGNIMALQKATELRVLYLTNTTVEGNIGALQKATKLEVLNLESTNIYGDMASLRELKSLVVVKITGTRITGTQCSRDEEVLRQVLLGLGFEEDELSDLHDVEGVDWSRCDVLKIDFRNRAELRGSLSEAFRKLPKLERLELRGTKVSGDLAVLEKCNELTKLDFSETKVTGDLKALENVMGLERLYLSQTEVAGDLKSLQNATDLRRLHLSDTKVEGDLKALPKATELRSLDLSNTKVEGNIESLHKATKLQWLYLSNTNVFGYMASLREAKELKDVKITGTQIAGDIGALQNAKRLKKVDLSKSKVSGDINSLEDANDLSYLDISETSVGGNLSAVQLSWLVTFKASGCPLTGSFIGSSFQSLVTLDLRSTQISRVDGIASKCRTMLLADSASMSFAPGLLRHATENYILVDLRNVTFTDQSDAVALLESGKVKQSSVRTSFHNSRGFACYDLQDTSLQVSPEKFAPERLCTCMPGWTGTGANCTKCPEDTFKEYFSDTSDACIACPNGSTADEGSATHSSCMCNPGELYWKGGNWTCGCPEYEALDGNVCVKCDERNLECDTKGSDVLLAHPKSGFYRLGNEPKAVQCLEPQERCSPDRRDGSNDSVRATCLSNYTGTMCMDCAVTFYASGTRCEKCIDAEIPHAVLLLLAVALAVAGGLAALFVRNRMGAEAHETPCRRSTLMQQLKAQAPLLLQMCQLWGVLAAIASKTQPTGLEKGEDQSRPSFWEIPYIEVLQLSITNLKGTLNLQCRFDGPTVRFLSALAAPVFPLVALLCCFLVELLKPGLGITAALQALTLFYVGGASSTSSLLSCQRKDGEGEALPEAFAFRSSMPYFLCDDERALKKQVDVFGYAAAVCYILLIPCCLLYLYWRQRAVLRGSGTAMWAATPFNEGLHVRVSGLLPRTSTEKMPDEHTNRLIAAAAACIAVLYRGRVQVRIVDQAALVRPVDAVPGSTVEGDLLDIFEAEDASAEALKCRAIAEMLTERAILKDALPHDRVLSGAKNLLLKYALGRTIWMEIVQKLVAVALVAIVSKIEGAMMPVAVTLVMAVTSAMVQPYSQPQVNTLHCFSFLCLAVSAVSFAWAKPWPGRIALAAPFALSALQALRPDSAEALAIRLWQELERQIEVLEREEMVEVMVETYSFW